MIRFGTVEDITLICGILRDFHKETPYGHVELNEESIRRVVESVITGDRNSTILLVDEDTQFNGFIAATKTPFLVTGSLIASELFWYVTPEKRGSRVGLNLLDAFEYWAQKVGCDFCQLTTSTTEYEEKVSKLYTRRGYKLAEKTFLKELTDARN